MRKPPLLLSVTLGVVALLTVLSACREPFEDDTEIEVMLQPPPEAWIQLFNGKDLTGWTPKFVGHELGENYQNTFRVEDGVLKATYVDYEQFDGKFGHLFYAIPYSRYRLRAEYRFVGDQCPGGPGWAFRNNGLMLHGQDPKSMTLEQNFPVSMEVQLLGGDGTNERSTGNLCTPGMNVVMNVVMNVGMNDELVTTHCINSDSKTYHGDDWVTIEVEVLGSERVRHYLEGEMVMEYSQPQLDPRDGDAQRLGVEGDLLVSRGTISLQAESHPTEFRKIELLPLE
jgi:hypothetical protein